MALGSRLAAITEHMLRRYGEQVTVTRRPATAGGEPTVQYLWCTPQPLSPQAVNSLRLEGSLNLQNEEAHMFIFAGDADVLEGVDTITYAGTAYRVVAQHVNRQEGVNAECYAIGVRKS